MKPNAIFRWSAVLLSVACLAWSGCGAPKPKARAYDVVVEIDPSLREGSVRVDLVGVNPNDRASWYGYSMYRYWLPDDTLRRDAQPYEMNFTGSPEPKTLKATDSKWKTWLASGATDLFVLVDLPRKSECDDRPGDSDPRRRILSLYDTIWAGGVKELRIRVQESGVSILTPLRAVK